MIKLVESVCFSQPKFIDKVNEDAMLAPKKLSGGILLAVADGVGSYKGSELASLSAIEHLDKMTTDYEIKNFDKVFNSILEKVKSLSDYNVEYERASTTLTYCFIDDNGLSIGHIGDCRAYVKVGNKLKQLTKDQTQHQKFLDEKVFTKAQLKNVKGKNIITTAISQVVPMEYTHSFIGIHELLDDDGKVTIYIMSDGAHSFWDASPRFSNNTMKSVVKMGNSLQRRIERHGPRDDYTYIACTMKLC
ncbi:serine/threonine-protein phosphatase [Vibrio cholerae]|uniref:PP2C family protein-serine/threonine phosphatase n=1 Tax=Vibrio cholerae TaxID=666 RepID=UPI000BA92C7C|nr:PP2C family serine/threonine-protein phosphatase [Vibrio cholerae]EGQ7787927.1 serine/threonine-protein phosphatase [Vibrio cholerae]EKF9266672.1 serine/threonine-protein phosphatase [Vibrio cholerae]EKO4195386.1 serine/threonine-protein phosphatase [Vibrio cholerae]MBO1401645.1 hypothetical protein [Vibrio cholerae]PAS03015.1 hypothetical protein CGT80_18075 [Vibrio cholerae]